nr:MAG TPA: E3 ubiquitin-protein ligase [Caudoviricetes sp.]
MQLKSGRSPLSFCQIQRQMIYCSGDAFGKYLRC